MDRTGLQQFGTNVRRLRERKGYSQEDFAHHAKIGRAQYGRIERGEQNVELLTLLRLARALEVEPAELLRGVSVS